MTNPANDPKKVAETQARKRIPMSVPQRRLEVPDMPGYHLHWFLDRNVPRAVQAGYEFVDSRQVPILQHGVANPKDTSGNADLGSRVRVVGGTAANGDVEYLNLMKIREEWWKEDRRALEERNAAIIKSIFVDEEILGSEQSSPGDRGAAYVKTALFNRPRKGR